MGPAAWRRAIGESAWAHIRKEMLGINPRHDDMLANLLDRAVEVGFKAPELAPALQPSASPGKVLWPTEAGGVVPVATAEGVARWNAGRGHGFYLLRARQLVRAAGGLLLPRLQELLAAYEEECQRDNVSPLAPWADVRVFVGGERSAPEPDAIDGSYDNCWNHLFAESPEPTTVQRAHAAGPGKG